VVISKEGSVMKYTERKTCRVCGEELPKENMLNFGMQTIIDFLDDGEEGRGKAPLQLVSCKRCTLLQLRHTVEADTLFRKFWYRSSVNEQMRKALLDITDTVKKFVKFKTGDVVGDIGSNDGELLQNYPSELYRIGFEPATKLAEESQHRIPTANIISDYFSKERALKASGGKKYKAITAIAMFYDLDDPNKFVQDIVETLEDDGVFIVQMNYLMLMLRNLTFDNVGHEHLAYYSFAALKWLLENNGLKVVSVEMNDVNGGSIRVVARKGNNWPRSKTVREMLDLERGLDSEESYGQFANRVNTTTKHLKDFLSELKRAGKVVYAYGASTRGSTLLQTVLGETPASSLLKGVAERDPNKYGKKMAGLDLPIVAEYIAREAADYFLLLPYAFWESISNREKVWMLMGGKFIVPLPFPKVISFVDVALSSEFLMDQKPIQAELDHIK
jgi:NDP-4-keto-2,6-dideoxyhexose 3-C-methyltransferase